MADDSKNSFPHPELVWEPLRPIAFYGSRNVLKKYCQVRDRHDGPKLAIEEPVVLAFLGDLHNRSVLDLGCGDARLGREVLKRGARAYLGLDGSQQMVEVAIQNLAGTQGKIKLQDLESWLGEPAQRFEVVASQLTFQYLRNLRRVFKVVRAQIHPRGLFVFSIEHPIITSSYQGETTGGIATDWHVRGYFREGERVDRWLGSAVIKQHRTLETYFAELRNCGFKLNRFSEGSPAAARFEDKVIYELRREVPICAIFQCSPDLT